MKRMIAVALLTFPVLACGLLPAQMYRNWRYNAGYPLPGIPVQVYIGFQWDGRIMERLDTGQTVMVITLPLR